MKSIILAAALVVPVFTAQAAPVTYQITVTVTSAPHAPGSYAYNGWSFGALPGVFQGFFTADNAVTGSISNLQLVIGGLDLASTHNQIVSSSFNPAQLALNMLMQTANSGIVFGNPAPYNAPPNYVLAGESGNAPPVDPYYGIHQNWVGTYAINAVPEPATWGMLLAGGVLLGAMRNRDRRPSC